MTQIAPLLRSLALTPTFALAGAFLLAFTRAHTAAHAASASPLVWGGVTPENDPVNFHAGVLTLYSVGAMRLGTALQF